jgi:hypothetical protein
MDIMLDLETFGTTPGSAIRSIGAVTFELGRPEAGGENFYANISTRSCLYAGLRMEQGTAEWWEQQSDEARAHLLTDQLSLSLAVEKFQEWFTIKRATCVWAQGSNFDPVLWEAAAKACGNEKRWFVPWKFYNTRDTRTLYDLAKLDPRSIPREGTHHNALDDARHQVACCQAAYKKLFPVPAQAFA